MIGLPWEQVLALVAEAAGAEDGERRVLLVLADRSFHVKEVLGQASAADGLLGFAAEA